jgi:hypothetical protein
MAHSPNGKALPKKPSRSISLSSVELLAEPPPLSPISSTHPAESSPQIEGLILGEFDEDIAGESTQEPVLAELDLPHSAPRSVRVARSGAKVSCNGVTSHYGSHKTWRFNLKVLAPPLIALVGLMLLVPASWSVLLLLGVPVPGADRVDAPRMALAMLACWPLAVCLLASAGWFFVQERRHRQYAGSPRHIPRR